MRTLVPLIMLFFLIASFASSCRPSPQQIKSMEEARTLLREAGIDPSTLKRDEEDMIIDYDASTALKSRDQIARDWGAIFGILQWYAKDDVHIVITIDGKPVAKVKADIDNIRKFSKGEMKQEDFLNKITLSAVS